MFPSQSSLYAGMIHKLVKLRPWVRHVLVEASDILRQDLVQRYMSDDPEVLQPKADQRLAMFLVNFMYQQVLEEGGVDADLSLGFSLGEYNHLVHIGALDFAQALHLLVRPAPEGKPDPVGERALVYRISRKRLQGLVNRSLEAGGGIVELSGELSPHIHMVVGEPEPVARVLDLVKEETTRARAMKFPLRLPLHSSLLGEVGGRFAEHLKTVKFKVPHKPYLPNVLGRILRRPSREKLAELTARHLYEPIRWRQSIDSILKRYPKARLVEVGPRRVLCGLLYLEKSWHPGVKMYITDTMDEDTDRYIMKVIEELRRPPRIGLRRLRTFE